jgi:uncharacterized protein DUF4129
MIRPRTCILLLALLVAAPCLGASGPADLSPAQYRSELDRLLISTEKLDEPGARIPELMNSLPSAWRVSSERGAFEISTEWLRENLGTLGYKYDEEVAKKIRDRLTQLRADLDEYEKDPRDVSRQRALMAGILSRGEFRELHGPSWSDQLKQRLVQLLLRLLGRAITSSIFSNVGKFFVYGLMGVAFLAVAYWVYRSIRTSTRVESIVPENMPVSAREWRIWLAEARAAAQSGNWRDAVHLAYWAGISLLETQGAWRPDAARTPREYLRLIPEANPHRPTLSSLTRKFELVWYGGQPADEQVFAQTLEELEKLGCR